MAVPMSVCLLKLSFDGKRNISWKESGVPIHRLVVVIVASDAGEVLVVL
jgi:hypothetical protein